MSELLAAAEERWRLTVDNSPVGIALIALDGRLVDANDALCDMFGYTLSEMLSLRTSQVILPEDYDSLRGLTRDLLAGRIPRFQVRKRHVHSNGEVLWMDVFVALARDHSGRPANFIVYFDDVSEHIATAARLDRINHDLTAQTARLARSNDDLEAFATVASHDLQAPLSTIRGYLELLQAEYGDELPAPGRLWLSRASEAACRMSELLTSLLEFSRAAGSGEPRLRRILFHRVLERVLDDLDGTVKAAEVELRAVDTQTEVVADPSRLHQVLQNLLQNAVKYRHPARPPLVTVRVVEEPDAWRIEVADNGIGVPEADRDVVFGMFHQAGSDDEGFGVGLAVSRRIIERHGGSIWVEPVPEGGSRFCFTLPRTEGLPTPRTAP